MFTKHNWITIQFLSALLDNLQNLPKSRKPSASPSRNRTAGAGSASAKAAEEPQVKNYTPEQIEAVRRINKCKDFYQILGVTKESTDSEIKKAYKKLALQVHPDKNKAPGSVEAFKSVGNAVATLTDAEKRKRYDLYGDESQQERSQQTRYQYQNAFDADISPEEIFNLFFNGGYGAQNVYMRRGRTFRNQNEEYRQRTTGGTGGNQQQPQSTYGALINLLPILILIALSMMSSFFISDPIYSLQPSLWVLWAREGESDVVLGREFLAFIGLLLVRSRDFQLFTFEPSGLCFVVYLLNLKWSARVIIKLEGIELIKFYE